MSVKKAAAMISTYSADTFGACSALFELGGMIVVCDPSGCNSTYTTHDEPRWYDTDSLLYVSALTEADAILGNDQKLIDEVVAAARQQQPKFICLLASPIPAMLGTDLPAIAKIIAKATDIPAFSLPTNSMHYYPRGISLALAKLAQNLPPKTYPAVENHAVPNKPVINVLGVTPLDFSYPRQHRTMLNKLAADFSVAACWCMDSSLADISRSTDAAVNLVVTYGGLAAARHMEKEYDIPYVIGTPFPPLYETVRETILEVAATNRSQDIKDKFIATEKAPNDGAKKILLIGESIFSRSLAQALTVSTGQTVSVICPVETEDCLLRPGDCRATAEVELSPLFEQAAVIIADPLYKPLVPAAVKFVPLPHEGFSGRTYRVAIPNLFDETEYQKFVDEVINS